MDMTPSEFIAIELLKPHQEIMHSLLNPQGQLEYGAVYAFYEKLGRQLELSKVKRGNLFEEAIILTNEEVQDK